MTSCTASRVIRARPERAFEVATQYDALPESMPDHYIVSETRSRRQNVSVVHARFMLAGRECNVLAKHTEYRPHSHEIAIIGGDCRGSRIVETYEPLGDSTRLTIRADIRRRRFFDLRASVSKRDLETWLYGIADSIERAAHC